MFAQSIVAKGVDLVDILDQRLLTGRSQMRIFPVSLVQDQSLIKGSAVQQDIGSVNSDLPHTKIGADFILDLSFIKNPEGNVIQVRFLRRPSSHSPDKGILPCTRNIQHRSYMRSCHGRHTFCHKHTIKADHCLHEKLLTQTGGIPFDLIF